MMILFLALQNFKSNSYDLLLLDIKMPIMDGFELYKKLLSIDDKVKVCFITANEMYRDFFRNKLIPQLADMNNSNKCFFILKPIQNEDLIEQSKRNNHKIGSHLTSGVII